MTVTGHRPRAVRGPAVREAIVEAAADLFAEHGLRAVSADRILAAAGFSKVTFYRHFPTKDDVVVAYLERELDLVRAAIAAAGERPSDREALAAALTEEMCRPSFRGCPFINAAAEYPDAHHPVRAVVRDFRALMVAAIERWLDAIGSAAPEARPRLAEQIMMLRDGALVAGYLDQDAELVAQGLSDGIAALVTARP